MTGARICSQLTALVLDGSGYYLITGNGVSDLTLGVCVPQLQWEGGQTL